MLPGTVLAHGVAPTQLLCKDQHNMYHSFPFTTRDDMHRHTFLIEKQWTYDLF